jgi:hypothetical protein
MVSIRVIGEDDAVALASGKAEFELDAMPVTSCSAGTGELLGRSLILVAPPRPDVGSTRSSIVKNGRPRRRRDLMAMAAASPCAHREQLRGYRLPIFEMRASLCLPPDEFRLAMRSGRLD